MTSFNLRFLAPFAVTAGLTLVLVACGNKFDMPETESAAIAYVKSKVLTYYHRHPDKFSGDCPAFLNHALWGASENSDGWTVFAVGGSVRAAPPSAPLAEMKRVRELNRQISGDSRYWIRDDGRVISHWAMSGPSSCSGYWGSDPNP